MYVEICLDPEKECDVVARHSVPHIPREVGQGGTIWTVDIQTRKDGQRDIRDKRDPNEDGSDYGNLPGDGEEEYDQADEEQEHCDVKECENQFHHIGHGEPFEANEEERLDAGLFAGCRV